MPEGVQSERDVLGLSDAIRIPIDAADIRLRLSDRVAARLPGVARALAPRVIAAPAGSRLRVALISRLAAAGWAAYSHRDWDFTKRLYSPDVVWTTTPGIMPDILGPIAGWMAVSRYLDEAFEVAWSDQAPVELIDPGGPFMALRTTGTLAGRASGIEIEHDTLQLYEISPDGVVVRQWTTHTIEEAEAFLRQRLAQVPPPSRRS